MTTTEELRLSAQRLIEDEDGCVIGDHPDGLPLARLVLRFLDEQQRAPSADLETRLRSYVESDDDTEDRAEIRAVMVEAADAIESQRAALTEKATIARRALANVESDVDGEETRVAEICNRLRVDPAAR